MGVGLGGRKTREEIVSPIASVDLGNGVCVYVLSLIDQDYKQGLGSKIESQISTVLGRCLVGMERRSNWS